MASPKQTELYWKWPWSTTISDGWRMTIKNVAVPADETSQFLALTKLASAPRESERIMRINLVGKQRYSIITNGPEAYRELFLQRLLVVVAGGPQRPDGLCIRKLVRRKSYISPPIMRVHPRKRVIGGVLREF